MNDKKLKIKNNQATASDINQNWRINDDGLLRVTACILKEGVYPYGMDKASRSPGLDGLKTVMEYIPAEAFSSEEALKSLEGKPVMIGSHKWRDAENTLKDGLTVGSIAGAPYTQGGDLMVDFLIMDKEAVEKVTSGQLVEVSAGYDAYLSLTDGEYDGQAYNAEQEKITFNHVLLLPKGGGRCGHDVRIINHKKEDKKMSNRITKMFFGNKKGGTYQFTNSEDAETAEVMVAEQAALSGAEIEELLKKNKELGEQIAALMAEKEEAAKQLEGLKQQLDAALSSEATDEAVAGLAAQSADEEAIVETLVDDDETGNSDTEKEKEEILNSIRGGKTREMRRQNAVKAVLARQKTEVPKDWKQDNFDGAFRVMALNAKARIANSKNPEKILNGGGKGKIVNQAQTRRERVAASYVKNEK